LLFYCFPKFTRNHPAFTCQYAPGSWVRNLLSYLREFAPSVIIHGAIVARFRTSYCSVQALLDLTVFFTGTLFCMHDTALCMRCMLSGMWVCIVFLLRTREAQLFSAWYCL